MSNVYLAGPWAQKALLHRMHAYLRKRGLTVVSRWTTLPNTTDPAQLQAQALSDWADLQFSDTLIYFTGGVKSEGKATELGGALMANKQVLLVGERTNNVFLNLPQVRRFDSIGQAADFLQQQQLPVYHNE